MMNLPTVACLVSLFLAGQASLFAAAGDVPRPSAPYVAAFSKPGVSASTEVSHALAALNSTQPKAIAGVIEAAAQVWPTQLPSLLSRASEANPVWAPLMTAAAVGARPVDAVILRASAVAGLERAASLSSTPVTLARPAAKTLVAGKEIVGKAPVGKEPVGKETIPPEELEDDFYRGPGWMNLTPAQFAQLIQAINVAAATALRNGMVGNWLFDRVIETTVNKRIISIVLDPVSEVPPQIPEVVSPNQ